MCFCAIYWISTFKEVLLLGPEALVTKPGRAPIMAMCSHASGTHQITLRTGSSVRTHDSWRRVRLNSSTWGDSAAEGISVAIVGSASASVCQSLGAVGPEQPVSSWEMFLRVFKFKDYTYRIRFSEKGLSRLHFVVVLSKFLVISSKDHSLLYWKL